MRKSNKLADFLYRTQPPMQEHTDPELWPDDDRWMDGSPGLRDYDCTAPGGFYYGELDGDLAQPIPKPRIQVSGE